MQACQLQGMRMMIGAVLHQHPAAIQAKTKGKERRAMIISKWSVLLGAAMAQQLQSHTERIIMMLGANIIVPWAHGVSLEESLMQRSQIFQSMCLIAWLQLNSIQVTPWFLLEERWTVRSISGTWTLIDKIPQFVFLRSMNTITERQLQSLYGSSMSP